MGTLEAFNTDGLRTLLRTVNVPSIVEKTLRYPGHADRTSIVLLVAAGLYTHKGISPPEFVGRGAEAHAFVLHHLAERGG